MIQNQLEIKLSPYIEIYNLIVPKDNILRRINDLVDFSFIYDELLDKYCMDNGRNAIDPLRMFKYLLLKGIYALSDVDVVERSRYDMSFKYFLGMTPEEAVIDPSSLTKFRKLRLKDMNLLDILIGKTVEIAIHKGVLKSKNIIVDATHTKARYNPKTPREVLIEQTKKLRESIYAIDKKMKSKYPIKKSNGMLEDEIDYCNQLVTEIEKDELISSYPKVRERLNLLKETLQDDLEHNQASQDKDAKIGHKTADTSFFGYKTHLAMSEERIITAAVITSGEKNDGKKLEELIEKTQKTGIEVEAIIGDAAYSEKANIQYTKDNNINLVASMRRNVTHGHRSKEDEFDYNKDAGMYVCKAGHMAIRKQTGRNENKIKSARIAYLFDIEKCKVCLQREGCYKEGAKKKTYSVTVLPDIQDTQKEFQKSEYFQDKLKERYKIEAKNSELKNRHGYKDAIYSGLIGMDIQGASAIFAVNIKRIIKLIG